MASNADSAAAARQADFLCLGDLFLTVSPFGPSSWPGLGRDMARNALLQHAFPPRKRGAK